MCGCSLFYSMFYYDEQKLSVVCRSLPCIYMAGITINIFDPFMHNLFLIVTYLLCFVLHKARQGKLKYY